MKLKTRLFLTTAFAVLLVLGFSEWLGHRQTAAFLRDHAALMEVEMDRADLVIVGSRVLVEQFSGEEIATELDRILSRGGPSPTKIARLDKEITEMITRRVLIAGVASAAAAESAWARCGSRRTQQIVLTGRISAIGAESMELELARGVRTILFSERFNPAGFNTGDVVSVTCRLTADGDFMAERIARSGARSNSTPAGQQPSGHKH